VTWEPRGGWRVDALRNGRIVASRHCDDWHRVERARDALAAELQDTPAAAMAPAR
jgi:hypothetical protein